MRRLLIVTYHFPPSAASGGFRILGFARHLPKYGWDVSVVAPPSIPWEAVDRRLEDRIPPDTAVFRAPYAASKVARKFVGQPAWLPRAVRTSRRALRAHPVDAVLTSGPPHCVHLVGLYLKRRLGLPWVADFRDPWIANGYDPNAGRGLRGGLTLRLERAVLGGADAIVANAPLAAELVCASHPAQVGKVVTITNGYDAEDFSGPPSPPPPGMVDDAVNLVHTGSIYLGRNPGPLLDVLADLNREPEAKPIRLCLFGMGEHSSLAADVAKRGLDHNVWVGGQLPYEQALGAMRRAGVLLLLDTPGRRAGVPAKLYEYLGARRPILALGERGGDLEWALGASGAPYRIVSPTAPDAIRRALIDLSAEPREGRGDSAGLARFTREASAQRLVGVLNQSLADSPDDPLQEAGLSLQTSRPGV